MPGRRHRTRSAVNALGAPGPSSALTAPRVQILVGDKLLEYPELQAGDRLVALAELGELVVISKAAAEAAQLAVGRASAALAPLSAVSDDAIQRFFQEFAARLEDDATFAEIAHANAADVTSARARGRSVGRLELTARMRQDMIAGLRGW